MEVRKDSKNGVLVESASDTISTFQVQTQSCVEQWLQQLQDDPDRFADIEQQIDQHYRQGGGQLIPHSAHREWVVLHFPGLLAIGVART